MNMAPAKLTNYNILAGQFTQPAGDVHILIKCTNQEML